MKQIDNIGSFFRKRLLAEKPVEEDWNMPSDAIWDAAAIHFPKEKKKDRKFFILLFGSIVLLMLISYQLLQSSDQVNPIKTNHSPLTSQTSNENKNTSATVTSSEAHNDTRQASNPERVELAETKTDASITAQQESTDSNKAKNSIRNLSANKSVIELNKAQHQQKAISTFIDHDTSTGDTQINHHPHQVNQNLDKSNEKNIQDAKTNNLFGPTSIEQSTLLEYAVNPSLKSSTTKNSIHSLLFPKLDAISLKEFDIDASNLQMSPSPMIIVKEDRYKWEIGIEFSQFSNKPFWIIEDLLDEDDMFSLDLNQSGYNFTIAKKINNRFSLSSGLFYSKLDYDLGIRDIDIYDSDMPSEYLKKRIEDIISLGSISINNNSSDIIIEVLPSADLTRGDELIIDVQFPISLKAYLLPFLFNYHIYHQKWEWNLMTGISIDLIDIRVQDVDIQVLKNNDMIISPLGFDPISDQSLGGSIYLGGGLKYNITDRFNIGINYKIDVTETRLSKYSAGTYYRF